VLIKFIGLDLICTKDFTSPSVILVRVWFIWLENLFENPAGVPWELAVVWL
jgi:hypothetical protein